MEDDEKAAIGIFGAIVAIGIGVAAFLHFRKASLATPAPVAPAAAVTGVLRPAGAGWSNEERVSVVRNEEGFITDIVVHRDVQEQ